MSVQDTLDNREDIYGSYGRNMIVRARVLHLLFSLHHETNGDNMDSVHKQYIWDVVNKLMRCATSPTHLDNWHDLAGYALLAEEALKNE